THTPPTWPVALAVSSARKAASRPVSCRMSTPPSKTPRVQETLASRRLEPGLAASREREPVGDHPQRRRVYPEPEVAAPHLDVVVQLRGRLDAGLPHHDAVPARVHGGGRHLDRPGDLFRARQPDGI